MSPVGAQLWVAASYHFVNDSSENGTCCSAVSTQHASATLYANAPHLCIVESLIRNDRGAWNLGSSVVVQIQVYVVETHQKIKSS